MYIPYSSRPKTGFFFFFFEVKDRSVIDKSKRIQCIYLVQAAREQGRK